MKYLLILLSLVLSSCSFLLNEKSSDKTSNAPQTYSVVTGSGVISGLPADSTHLVSGTRLTLTAVVPNGFRVNRWVGACESITSNVCSFTVSNDVLVNVVLEPIPAVSRSLTLSPGDLVSLSYQIDSESPVSVSTATILSINVGQSVTINSSLVSNSEISGWQNSYGISTTSGSYSFIMPDQDIFSSPVAVCSTGFIQNGTQCDLDAFKVIANNLSMNGSVFVEIHDPGYTVDQYLSLNFYMSQSYFDMDTDYDFEDDLVFDFYGNSLTIVAIDNCDSQGGVSTISSSQYASCSFPSEVRPTLPLIVNTAPIFSVNVNSTYAKDSTNMELSIDIPDLSINCSNSSSNCYYEGAASGQLINVSLSGIPDQNLYNFKGWKIFDSSYNLIETKGPTSNISVLFDKSLNIQLDVEQYTSYNLHLALTGGYNLEHVVITEDGNEIEDCYGTCDLELRNNNHQIKLTPVVNGGSSFSGFTIGNNSVVSQTYTFNSSDPVTNGLLSSNNDFKIESNFSNSQRISNIFSQKHLDSNDSIIFGSKYLSPATNIVNTVADNMFYLDGNDYTIKYASITNPLSPGTAIGAINNLNLQTYNGYGSPQYSILAGTQNGSNGHDTAFYNVDYLNKTLSQIKLIDACDTTSPPLIKTGINTGFISCKNGYALKVYSYTIDLPTNSFVTNKIYDSMDNPGWGFDEYLGANEYGVLFTGFINGAVRLILIHPDGSFDAIVRNFNFIYSSYTEGSRVRFVTDISTLASVDLSFGLISYGGRPIERPNNGSAFYEGFAYDFYANQGKQIRAYGFNGDVKFYMISDQDAVNCYPMNFANQTVTTNNRYESIPLLISCDSYSRNGTYKIFMLDRNHDKFIKLVETTRSATGVDVQSSLRIGDTLFLVFKNTYQEDYSQLFKIDLLDMKNSREIFKAKTVNFTLSPSQNPNFVKYGLQSQFGLRASSTHLFFGVRQKDMYGDETNGIPDSEETLLYSIDITN